MTKERFLAKVAALYRVGNASDSTDSPEREDWTKPSMASTVCQRLDQMLTSLVEDGVLTADEKQMFYDDLV